MAREILNETGTNFIGLEMAAINRMFTELYTEKDALSATDTKAISDGASHNIINLDSARTFEREIAAGQSFELQNVELNQFFTIIATTGSGSFATPFFTHATLTCAIETDGQNWWPGESDGGGGTIAAYDNSKNMEGSFKVMRITGTHIYLRQNLVNK